jgi:hypothetical protein
MRLIRGESIPEVKHTARFHTNPAPGAVKTYIEEFEQPMAPELAGRYFLFSKIDKVTNPFDMECSSSLEWFLKTQTAIAKCNNEMNGQSLMDIRVPLGLPLAGNPTSLFFATPSFRFAGEVRASILGDSLSSVREGCFDAALFYTDDLRGLSTDGLQAEAVSPNFSIVAKSISAEALVALRQIAA